MWDPETVKRLTFERNKGSGFIETEGEAERRQPDEGGVWIWWKKDVGLSLRVTVIKSLILLRSVGETKSVCSDHGKWASLSPVTLLMTHALIPASFIKGQNGEGAGFNLELIVIIAPDN